VAARLLPDLTRCIIRAIASGLIDPEMFPRLWRVRSGSSVIEYAFLITLMIALIAIAIVAASDWLEAMWAAFLGALR
jgi:Flp pilus assembly pilin Flp